jgi:hypothetical protein
MVRVAVAVVAFAGLTVLAAGVVDAVPLVFWGSTEEYASVDHERRVMLIGTALTLAAAATAPNRRAGALLAFAPVLPVGLALGAGGTSFGVLVLPVAIGIGVAGLIAVFAGRSTAA